MWYIILVIVLNTSTGPVENLIRFGNFWNQEDCEFTINFLISDKFDKSQPVESAEMSCGHDDGEAQS